MNQAETGVGERPEARVVRKRQCQDSIAADLLPLAAGDVDEPLKWFIRRKLDVNRSNRVVGAVGRSLDEHRWQLATSEFFESRIRTNER